MLQVALNFEPVKKARSSDPLTSKRAATRASDFAATHAGRILLALQQHGPMTAKEIGERIGLNHVAVDRRRSDLIRLGFVDVHCVDGEPVVRDGCQVLAAVNPTSRSAR